MLPRRHALNLTLLAIPWLAVVVGFLRGGGGGGGIFLVGDYSGFCARLAVALYGIEAFLVTLIIAALNWRRLRPRSPAFVYWVFAAPTILFGVLALPFALGGP